MDIKKIGYRIAELRIAQQWSQKQFAELVQVAQPVLNRAEKGEQRPSATMLFKFIKIGISIDWLLTGKGEMFLSGQGYKIGVEKPESEVSEFSCINGNAEDYPQITKIEQVARTGWWKNLSKESMKLYALNELLPNDCTERLSNAAEYEYNSNRDRVDKMRKITVYEKGDAG